MSNMKIKLRIDKNIVVDNRFLSNHSKPYAILKISLRQH